MELYFIATPAVGEYYFLHPRELKEEYTSIHDFYSRRGTNGAIVLDRENAEALIAEFFIRGIEGSEKYRLINVDNIFGFLRDQQIAAEILEKKYFTIQKPTTHVGENNSNECPGQRVGNR